MSASVQQSAAAPVPGSELQAQGARVAQVPSLPSFGLGFAGGQEFAEALNKLTGKTFTILTSALGVGTGQTRWLNVGDLAAAMHQLAPWKAMSTKEIAQELLRANRSSSAKLGGVAVLKLGSQLFIPRLNSMEALWQQNPAEAVTAQSPLGQSLQALKPAFKYQDPVEQFKRNVASIAKPTPANTTADSAREIPRGAFGASPIDKPVAPSAPLLDLHPDPNDPQAKDLDATVTALKQGVDDFASGKISWHELAALRSAADLQVSQAKLREQGESMLHVESAVTGPRERLELQISRVATQQRRLGDDHGWDVGKDLLQPNKEAFAKGGLSFGQIGQVLVQARQTFDKDAGHWSSDARSYYAQQVEQITALVDAHTDVNVQQRNALLAAADAYQRDPTPQTLTALRTVRGKVNDEFNAGRVAPTQGPQVKAALAQVNRQFASVEFGGKVAAIVNQAPTLPTLTANYRTALNTGDAQQIKQARAALNERVGRVRTEENKAGMDTPDAAVADAGNALKSKPVGASSVQDIPDGGKAATFVGARIPGGGPLLQARLVKVQTFVGQKEAPSTQGMRASYRAVDVTATDIEGTTVPVNGQKPFDVPAARSNTLEDAKAAVRQHLADIPGNAKAAAQADAQQRAPGTYETAHAAVQVAGGLSSPVLLDQIEKAMPTAAKYLAADNKMVEYQGTDVDNFAGMAMGFAPTVIPAQGAGPRLLFDGDAYQNIKPVADAVRRVGGDRPEMTAIPVFLRAEGDRLATTSLLRVAAKDGGERYVDNVGNVYRDLKDWKASNKLGATDVFVPAGGRMSTDASGKLQLEGFSNRRLDNTALPIVRGGVALLGAGAGVASIIGTGGAATPIVAAGASLFSLADSAYTLKNDADHGRPITLRDEAVRDSVVNVASNVLNLGGLGTAGKIGHAFSTAATVADGLQTLDTGRRYLRDVASMNPGERFASGAQILFSAAMMGAMAKKGGHFDFDMLATNKTSAGHPTPSHSGEPSSAVSAGTRPVTPSSGGSSTRSTTSSAVSAGTRPVTLRSGLPPGSDGSTGNRLTPRTPERSVRRTPPPPDGPRVQHPDHKPPQSPAANASSNDVQGHSREQQRPADPPSTAPAAHGEAQKEALDRLGKQGLEFHPGATGTPLTAEQTTAVAEAIRQSKNYPAASQMVLDVSRATGVPYKTLAADPSIRKALDEHAPPVHKSHPAEGSEPATHPVDPHLVLNSNGTPNTPSQRFTRQWEDVARLDPKAPLGRSTAVLYRSNLQEYLNEVGRSISRVDPIYSDSYDMPRRLQLLRDHVSQPVDSAGDMKFLMEQAAILKVDANLGLSHHRGRVQPDEVAGIQPISVIEKEIQTRFNVRHQQFLQLVDDLPLARIGNSSTKELTLHGQQVATLHDGVLNVDMHAALDLLRKHGNQGVPAVDKILAFVARSGEGDGVITRDVRLALRIGAPAPDGLVRSPTGRMQDFRVKSKDREYFKDRGITDPVVQKQEVAFARDWHSTFDLLAEHGMTFREVAFKFGQDSMRNPIGHQNSRVTTSVYGSAHSGFVPTFADASLCDPNEIAQLVLRDYRSRQATASGGVRERIGLGRTTTRTVALRYPAKMEPELRAQVQDIVAKSMTAESLDLARKGNNRSNAAEIRNWLQTATGLATGIGGSLVGYNVFNVNRETAAIDTDINEKLNGRRTDSKPNGSQDTGKLDRQRDSEDDSLSGARDAGIDLMLHRPPDKAKFTAGKSGAALEQALAKYDKTVAVWQKALPVTDWNGKPLGSLAPQEWLPRVKDFIAKFGVVSVKNGLTEYFKHSYDAVSIAAQDAQIAYTSKDPAKVKAATELLDQLRGSLNYLNSQRQFAEGWLNERSRELKATRKDIPVWPLGQREGGAALRSGRRGRPGHGRQHHHEFGRAGDDGAEQSVGHVREHQQQSHLDRRERPERGGDTAAR